MRSASAKTPAPTVSANAPSPLLQALESRGARAVDAKAEKQLLSLLSTPLDAYPVVTVLGLRHYPRVMALLSPPTRWVCISTPFTFQILLAVEVSSHKTIRLELMCRDRS